MEKMVTGDGSKLVQRWKQLFCIGFPSHQPFWEGDMRKDLKELKTDDLDLLVKGKSKCKYFRMREAGIPVVLGHSEAS